MLNQGTGGDEGSVASETRTIVLERLMNGGAEMGVVIVLILKGAVAGRAVEIGCGVSRFRRSIDNMIDRGLRTGMRAITG